MRFKNPNTSRIAKNKIFALFNRIVKRNAEHNRGSIFEVLSQLFIEFKRFFIKIKSPRFEFTPLTKGDVVVAERYNDTNMDAIEDLTVCTDEINAIKPMIIGSYNSARQMAKELENRSESALSKITDIRLFEGQLGQEIIVVGDDFLNTNKIDESFSLSAPSADIRPSEGLVTLNRIESINLVNEDVSITCEPTMPGDIDIDNATGSNNVNRYYEGNFYDFIGNARPEGGNWHLEERLYGIDEDDLNASVTVVAQDAVPAAFNNTMDGALTPGTVLRPQDITIYDRGASKEEKNIIRKRMFDEDSATFWEAEYIRDFTPSQTEDIDLTLDELAAEVIQQDTKDFEVKLTIDFGSEKQLTWLSLDPINFGETAWVEITDIGTQSSQEEGFKTIPSLFNNRFANTLTNEANEELQADVASQILSPDRSSFKGKGVFNFPTVSAQYIQIKIRQKVPVPNLYQRLTAQLTRSIDTTLSESESSSGFLGFGASSSSSTTITQTRMSRLVKLTYLQTVKTHFNNQGINEYAGETAPSSNMISSSEDGRRHGLIGFIVDLIFGSSQSQSSISSNDSGWRLSKSWLETYYNKMRYAIGIRELSVFGYKFSPTSEFVSKKFTSPKEIIKAQLEVIEEIPSEFDPSQRYIEYYLSFDDENWHRVNPTGSPSLYLDGGQIAPEILTINFDVAGSGPNQSVRAITTDTPATSVRLKVVMKNDPSVGNANSYTPVLKKYRVKLSPRTSLSRA